jgi:hypothetical protein
MISRLSEKEIYCRCLNSCNVYEKKKYQKKGEEKRKLFVKSLKVDDGGDVALSEVDTQFDGDNCLKKSTFRCVRCAMGGRTTSLREIQEK